MTFVCGVIAESAIPRRKPDDQSDYYNHPQEENCD